MILLLKSVVAVEKKIKLYKNFICDNVRLILEILIMILVILLPSWFDFNGALLDGKISNILNYSEILTYILRESDHFSQFCFNVNNFLMGMALFIMAFMAVRKFNSDYIMNTSEIYHDYPYRWYQFCASILGVKTCFLIRVPIYIQFQIVINGIFKEVFTEKEEYGSVENEKITNKFIGNISENTQEINIVLEDTYPIETGQLPDEKRGLTTIKISRSAEKFYLRCYSKNFIDDITKIVRNLPEGIIVNLYATTNPKHTKSIAENVFNLGNDRQNVKHLYVFQQKHDKKRIFGFPGHRIF